MSSQVQVIPNVSHYVNKSTANSHKVSSLSNGQFLIDGYFVINKYQLESDFEMVPIMFGVIGVSNHEISPHSQELKAHVENFQQQGMDHDQHCKLTGMGYCTHVPKEDEETRSRNIINITTEFATANINALLVEDKPIHVRVIDTHLIPDGYYATSLTIADVDQPDIYCLYK